MQIVKEICSIETKNLFVNDQGLVVENIEKGKPIEVCRSINKELFYSEFYSILES
jgi:hypothetical protein